VDVHVQLDRRGALAEQIYRQLLDAIFDRRLRPGERLPATRELAARLQVSRNTVSIAYERLAAEGVLASQVGAGSFVTREPLPGTSVTARRAPAGTVHPRELWRTIPVLATERPPAGTFDFSPGTPDWDLFPLTVWRRLIANEFRASAARYAAYGHPAGHAALRAAIARHVGVSRAVRAVADDVVVTQGAQQAFDLIGRVLIGEGTCVAVEDPGYSRVRLLYRSLGARVVAVPVDDEGLIVEAIPQGVRLVYVTPSHQFPLGITMSLRRRTALLAWAERRGGVIVEDDYDSEFRFGGRPLDPLQSLDRAGRVIYVGSFSKVLLPALRLGFLVAPATLQDALHAARQLADWHGELATQAALARFIDEGLLARHIRTVTREYARRYTRIAAALDRGFSRWLRVVPAVAGMHLTATVAPAASVDIAQVVRHAERRGVAVRALAGFYQDAVSTDGLVLGYGGVSGPRIDEGLARLAAAFDAAAARGSA
jgi:GntR family transcriptional regulator/MocR family aminotransferase